MEYMKTIRLADVDLALAEARQVATFSERNKCDTCMFTDRDCVIKTDKVCGTCLSLFGCPFCSWTPDIPATSIGGTGGLGNLYEALEARGDTANTLQRTALCGLQGTTGEVAIYADDEKWG
jgi:hypothetical protein